MTQLISDLKEILDKLKVSSSFSAGDAGSFSIKIVKDSLGLPGKYEATSYFDALQLMKVDSVAIVFPGNGGLCVEALHRNASNVWAIEPRANYHRALSTVSEVALRALGKSFTVFTGANWFDGKTGIPKFNTVIWSEGLDQVSQPKTALKYVQTLIAPGGSLFIEVTHGQHDAPGDSINSWKPKEAAFMKEVGEIFKNASFKAMKGRLDRRVIYQITLPGEEVSPVEAVVEKESKELQPSQKPKKIRLKKKN